MAFLAFSLFQVLLKEVVSSDNLSQTKLPRKHQVIKTIPENKEDFKFLDKIINLHNVMHNLITITDNEFIRYVIELHFMDLFVVLLEIQNI